MCYGFFMTDKKVKNKNKQDRELTVAIPRPLHKMLKTYSSKEGWRIKDVVAVSVEKYLKHEIKDEELWADLWGAD